MALPSYLVRRDGGRYHVQMRLGAAMARSLESSHLRFSLRTADGRQARRRLLDCIEWAYAFKEAPDLEAAGAVIARSLEQAIVRGPPDLKHLPSRLILEKYATDFIRRSRERDFAWVAHQPGLIHLLKAFTVQNAAAESAPAPPRAERSTIAGRDMPADVTFPTAQADLVERPHVPMSGRVEQLLETLIERLDGDTSSKFSSASFAKTRVETRARPREHDDAAESVPISIAITRFLDAEAVRSGHRKGDARFRPILQFMSDFYGDAMLPSLTADRLKALDEAILDIPGLKSCPLALRRSLHDRYTFAQEEGWGGLSRITTTTLDLRYRTPLRIFFRWAIKTQLYSAPMPTFTAKSDEILASLPRDRLQDEEILRFISAPLFTGCAGPHRVWVPGKYLVQSDFYWIFLILLLTGMRTGEPPQIRLDDITRVDEVTDAGEKLIVYFFDMRPYNPAEGRKPLKALKNLKRADFSRVIPIHPLLLDLGLLNRVERLRSLGAERLFPDIKPYKTKNGEVRWGKTISKAFAHARTKPSIALSRANICLYSTRQLMADWLDSLNTPQRVRNRVLGHINDSNAADQYGSKGMMPVAQANFITGLETQVIRDMRFLLMGALARVSEGKLTRIEPVLRRSVDVVKHKV